MISSTGQYRSPAPRIQMWNMGKPKDNDPLVNYNIVIAIEHGPFSSLIYLLKMVIFHSKLLVYQRVSPSMVGNLHIQW